MRRIRCACLGAALATAWFVTGPGDPVKADPDGLSISVQSIDGQNGHAFVYLEGSESGGTSAIATHPLADCSFPYAEWTPSGSPQPGYFAYRYTLYNCDGSRYDTDEVRYDGELIQGPQRSIVGLAESAGLVMPIGLSVSATPNPATAGSPIVIAANLDADIASLVSGYLGVGVVRWSAAHWTVDFGDGETQSLGDSGHQGIEVTHTYVSYGPAAPQVTALIQGTAEVADFDDDGGVFVEEAPFSVHVTSSATATVLTPPVQYFAPQIVPAVSAVIEGSGESPASTGTTTVEVPRGRAMDLYVRPIVRQAAYSQQGTREWGATTQITMWRDDWAYGDLAMPIRGRWDAPPPAQNGTYSISVELVAVSQYADGTVRTYSFTGQIGIDVGFAAEADIGSGS